MTLENSCFKVRGSRAFTKKISIPTSKSFANRALILAATIREPVYINNLPESTDVKNLIHALKAINLRITETSDGVVVHNSFPECELLQDEVVQIETGDGGTTNRFLIPLLALGQNIYEVIPTHKMKDRPMSELDSVLKSLGVKVLRDENVWFCLQGPIQLAKHNIEVDCSESTQFATGLALTLSQFHVDIVPINLKTSTPYWEMTLELIKRMDTERNIDVPVDFSSLSYPLAFAALSGEVIVNNCFGVDRYQADSIFIKILEDVGADLRYLRDGLRVQKKELKTFNFDAKDCPDLIPTLCFLASYIDGKSTIRSVNVLRHKESDRLSEIQRMMNAFGVESEYDEIRDCLHIKGNSKHTSPPVRYTPPVDHRMVMVAYLFMRYNAGGELYNYSCVNKSFPNFFDVME